MAMVDWEELWDREIRLSRRERLGKGEHWDRVAAEGATVNPRLEQVTEEQLRLIGPREDSRVLEIGPGAGRLTLPLSRSAAELLAVEPSGGMAARLQSRLDEEGVGNVSINVGSWQEVSPTLGDGSWDIVVASYCLFMLRIGHQLEEMSRVARERVCLFVPAQKRMTPELELAVLGERTSSPHSDSEIIINILRSQGRSPDLRILERRIDESYPSLEAALERKARFHDCPPERLPMLRELLQRQLEEEGGLYWERGIRRSAFISWEP